MEIFLLFVVIILLIIFHTIKNSKITTLEKKISHIENYLKQLHLKQSIENIGAEKQLKESTPIIKPQTKSEPIKVEPEKKPEPIKEEPKIANVVQTEKVISTPDNTGKISEKPKETIPAKKPVVPSESWYERFRKNNPDLEKFIGENIVSKIGIAILVIGIAFFVKYAIDQNWINEVARVGIGVLCGGIVLGFAHKLHKQFKAFSSVLVAGGISIFYFTIGIAFHEYKLFDQSIAFVIMVFITGFSVFISVAYNRMELAALSLIGGFATPFMLSTGEGNYKVLFTYLLILDIGMLVLAYLRKWNLINILAYAFTVIIYTGWLESKVMPASAAPYKGALIFNGVFYVVFLLMNIINNLKEKKTFGALDLSILISNTFIFYVLGMQVLSVYKPELKGLYSILMALFNMGCSWLLYKKYKADTRLVYLMIGLTLTFVTLAAPVQLKGNYITLFWSLEALLLMWLAQRSGFVIYRFASIIIVGLMTVSLFMDWVKVYGQAYDTIQPLILNKGFITGFVASLSLLATFVVIKKEYEKLQYLGISFNPSGYRIFLMISFALVIYTTGLIELIYQLNKRLSGPHAMMIIINCYHMGFMVITNTLYMRLIKPAIHPILYVISYISLAVFLLLFVYVPLSDIKQRLLYGNIGYTGFIFHYLALIASALMVVSMRRTVLSKDYFFKPALNFHSSLLSIAIIYTLSIELMIHLEQFICHPVYAGTYDLQTEKIIEINKLQEHTIKIGFPILWGILAFVILFMGMKQKTKSLRIIALILIAITLLKLFIYDINNATEAGKIVAFIILGIVLLIISFMYQKIKALLIDDKKPASENNEQA